MRKNSRESLVAGEVMLQRQLIFVVGVPVLLTVAGSFAQLRMPTGGETAVTEAEFV